MKCLGLFYLHYKTEFVPQKTIIAPYVYKKSTIFAIEITDRAVWWHRNMSFTLKIFFHKKFKFSVI